MSLRLPLHRIDELRAISNREDRPVTWLIKRGIDLLIESYSSSEKPTPAETQQAPAPAATAPAASASAPDPVVAALTKTEWFKEIVAKLKAELDQPAELAAEPKAKPERKQYQLLVKGVPVHSVEPAVAVPPMSISKHSVKH